MPKPIVTSLVTPLVSQIQYDYSKFIPAIANRDVELVLRKDKEYGASWLEYGGIGAFFVTVRKWDRIRNQLHRHGWDVFKAYADGTTSEAFADTVMDLRGYLFNWEARAIELDLVAPPQPKWVPVRTSLDDGQQEAYGAELKEMRRLLTPLSRGEETFPETLARLISERDLNSGTDQGQDDPLVMMLQAYAGREEGPAQTLRRVLAERQELMSMVQSRLGMGQSHDAIKATTLVLAREPQG